MNSNKDDIVKIKKARKDWEKRLLSPLISAHPERKPHFSTYSDIEKKRLYTPEDNLNAEYLSKSGFPGELPFTRGVQPTMYRGKFWTMRQYSGFGTAEESNKRYKYLLEQGQTGLSVAFDLPTQIGYDSDDPLSYGEVGKVGVAIDSLEDMQILFDGIPLDAVSTSMTINAPAAILLAMYIVVAEQQGISQDELSGTIQNDILKEYIARGTYIFPPGPSMRLITDIFSYCINNLPKWNTISISGYHIREAGSTAVQEIGFTLANGISYVDSAINAGLDIDAFAPRLSFFFNAHNDLFEEAAKFRAARRLWADIMKNRFKASNPSSMKLRFHTQTGGSTLTAQQPYNNIIRVAVQAIAAVCGGTQSLHTNSMDEALALPTEESARIALRTQQVIAHESGIADVVDPLGGSYYVEYLTNEIEKRAASLIEKIDEMGGMVTAIERGFPQREIQKSAYLYQLDLERKEQIVVGINDYRQEEKPPENILKIDYKIQENQVERVRELRKKRDKNKVNRSLNELRNCAQDNCNLFPAIIQSVKSYATIGEICYVLRSVFGEHKDSFSF